MNDSSGNEKKYAWLYLSFRYFTFKEGHHARGGEKQSRRQGVFIFLKENFWNQSKLFLFNNILPEEFLVKGNFDK